MNFLFDRSQPLHLTGDDLSDLTGVPKSTMANKSKQIRDLLGLEDVTRGCARSRVVSHDVSSHVHTNDMFVGHLMPGPPAASLWGPMAMLDRRAGHELIDLQ